MVLGEKGVGKSMFAKALFSEMQGEYRTAMAIYTKPKKFYRAIAFQLGIPTEYEGKKLSVEQLEDEIHKNINQHTLLILPKAKRLSAGIKYWLEQLMDDGAILVCLEVVRPKGDIFLEMLEIELDLPSNKVIRDIMKAEAEILGLDLTKAELAELQPLAGRNPFLAKKTIRKHKLGIKQKAQHTQYVNIMPIFFAVIMFFAILRFVGMGTKNKSLYIFGGVSLAGLMSLKQLGSIKGAQKRLGQ